MEPYMCMAESPHSSPETVTILVKQLYQYNLVKAMVFPVVMYGCESWTLKKADNRISYKWTSKDMMGYILLCVGTLDFLQRLGPALQRWGSLCPLLTELPCPRRQPLGLHPTPRRVTDRTELRSQPA